jgi:phosphosulfolactate synthase
VSRDFLDLPHRTDKPRAAGLTMVIDRGLPWRHLADVVESAGEYIDFVKFGWGTSVVARDTARKIEVLRAEGVGFYFGGTLFEKYVLQDRFDEFRLMCLLYDCTHVEVSNGTIDLDDDAKAGYVARLAGDFAVVSEVGVKDAQRSEAMAPTAWIRAIRADLAAGASLVTLETREGGRSGICRPNGELRYGLVEEILTSGVDADSLLFEAPTAALQGHFVNRVGPNVNLGNVASTDVISLETIRLGLRSETLHAFESAPAASVVIGP